jgi:beta-glucosidase
METAVPLIEAPEHIKAAQTATREMIAPFLSVMLEGRYTEAYLKDTGKDAPKFTDEDVKIITSPLDFVGINQSPVCRSGSVTSRSHRFTDEASFDNWVQL